VSFDDHVVDRLKLDRIGLRLPVLEIREERCVFKSSVPFGYLRLSRRDSVGGLLSHRGYSAAAFEAQFYHSLIHYALTGLEYFLLMPLARLTTALV